MSNGTSVEQRKETREKNNCTICKMYLISYTCIHTFRVNINICLPTNIDPTTTNINGFHENSVPLKASNNFILSKVKMMIIYSAIFMLFISFNTLANIDFV